MRFATWGFLALASCGGQVVIPEGTVTQTAVSLRFEQQPAQGLIFVVATRREHGGEAIRNVIWPALMARAKEIARGEGGLDALENPVDFVAYVTTADPDATAQSFSWTESEASMDGATAFANAASRALYELPDVEPNADTLRATKSKVESLAHVTRMHANGSREWQTFLVVDDPSFDELADLDWRVISSTHSWFGFGTYVFGGRGMCLPRKPRSCRVLASIPADQPCDENRGWTDTHETLLDLPDGQHLCIVTELTGSARNGCQLADTLRKSVSGWCPAPAPLRSDCPETPWLVGRAAPPFATIQFVCNE